MCNTYWLQATFQKLIACTWHTLMFMHSKNNLLLVSLPRAGGTAGPELQTWTCWHCVFATGWYVLCPIFGALHQWHCVLVYLNIVWLTSVEVQRCNCRSQHFLHCQTRVMFLIVRQEQDFTQRPAQQPSILSSQLNKPAFQRTCNSFCSLRSIL